MSSGELKKAKRDVRRRVLALRDQLSAEEREMLGALAVDRFLNLPQTARAEVVMAFWSFGSEIQTAPLIESLSQRGVKVALPKIEGRFLEPRLLTPGLPTTPTTFGAREPEGGPDGAPVVDPELIDIVIVPAVAYDRRGRRVGYGGGFYDRFLPSTRAETLRIGLGFDLQLIDGDLPSGAFDTGVDLVVTTSEIVSCPRS
jgi:5,10-methenyltetrahydrofolate synthetase